MPTGIPAAVRLPEYLQRILEARHHDPFEVLGRHVKEGVCTLTLFLPKAEGVRVAGTQVEVPRIEGTDLFVWVGDPAQVPPGYRIDWTDAQGQVHRLIDPYAFPAQLEDFDLHLFGEGRHWHAYRFLGAHPRVVAGVTGTLFAVWAPNAQRVSVVGNFNAWDGRLHPMRARGGSGVWEIFLPALGPGEFYKFELRDQHGNVHVKIDPYATAFQTRPETACITQGDSDFAWDDTAWLETRAQADWSHQPLSVYEVHLSSWQRSADGNFLGYREIAERLADYVQEVGFTHIELLPITEHPLDASWGYQTTGYFAPTSRFGTPEDFRWFVNHLHRKGIGVLLDWVPAHFPRDTFALARYDGSALYEHEDPRMGEHKDWGTLIFNFGRNEVKNFLLSSALFWLEEFHLDGLRVDAVASMLYLDYSRNAGEWIPNRYGGNENLEAVDFLRQLNEITHGQQPGTLMIAEESTAWPAVSRPTFAGGLGFTMKWNMGWMHDTLAYFSKDPIYRHYHHDMLTFGLLYAFTENFVLPFSHDEVVHGKRSLLDRMPGDSWRKFAGLRLLYTFMFSYPGKKLLFQGCEFGQGQEWNFAGELDWYLLERAPHQGIHHLVADLNRLYRRQRALYDLDFQDTGFEWLDCNDSSQSVLSYLRKDRTGDAKVLALFNFTPVPRPSYRLGVPEAGYYREVINSDNEIYGGSSYGERVGGASEPMAWMGRPHSILVDLPPLAGVILVLDPFADTSQPTQEPDEAQDADAQ
ncbi:MAG: 1,4-alpha-glucan branching protein GlgB [Chromatiaceae bacterium]